MGEGKGASVQQNKKYNKGLPSSDGQRSFFMNTSDSGYDIGLRSNWDPNPEDDLTDTQLNQLPRVSDDELTKRLEEETAEMNDELFHDREDYEDKDEYIAEGNKIFEKELKLYMKARNPKVQKVELGDVIY